MAIFNQIHPRREQDLAVDPTIRAASVMQYPPANAVDLETLADHVAEILKQLLTEFDLADMEDLVSFWHAKGVNLALAAPVVQQCIESMNHLRTMILPHETDWHSKMTRYLLQNSARPLEINANSTMSDFTNQFCGRNVRWETLGIFFAAVIRATFDVSFFPQLYKTESERHDLRKLATRLNHYSLELCISLNCLSDIQLVFQYENFIVRSYMDGDHSKSLS